MGGERPSPPDLRSGFARARLSGCLPARLACGHLEGEVGGFRRGGPSGSCPHSWTVARQSGSRAEPLHRAGGTTRAEGAAASSGPPIAVIEGDGCIEASRSSAPVIGLHRPNYQDPPGSRVLLGGSWPSWTPPQTREPAPSPSGSADPCPGSGQWLLKLGRRHHGSRLGATGRWCVWCRSAPQTTAAGRQGRPGTPCPSGFELGGEGDA